MKRDSEISGEKGWMIKILYFHSANFYGAFSIDFLVDAVLKGITNYLHRATMIRLVFISIQPLSGSSQVIILFKNGLVPFRAQLLIL